MASRLALTRPLSHALSKPIRPGGIRTMAAAAVQTPPLGKYEFLVIVHDKPGVLAKRLQVRSQHFQGIEPFVQRGSHKTGGAILNSVPKDDKPESLDFAGSTLVLVSDSVESVRELLGKDIYATSGVWDMDTLQIYPYKCAFRNP